MTSNQFQTAIFGKYIPTAVGKIQSVRVDTSTRICYCEESLIGLITYCYFHLSQNALYNIFLLIHKSLSYECVQLNLNRITLSHASEDKDISFITTC